MTKRLVSILHIAWPRALALMLVVVLTVQAQACGPQVRVDFFEDSPDRFRIAFVHGPKRQLRSLRLEMTQSQGGAHVDTNYGPSQSAKSGEVVVSATAGFAEGSYGGTLEFSRFPEGASLDYLIDLDVMRPIHGEDYNHVAGGEMKGAQAWATIITPDGRTEIIEGRFDAEGRALLAPKACV